jgi:predicted ATPase
MEKLIVKNFGPICDVEIELKDLTIFIGETGTGKSTLAKLIAIFRDMSFWKGLVDDEASKERYFESRLKYYQISNTFLVDDSHIEYHADTNLFGIDFKYNDGLVAENFVDFFKEASESVSPMRIDTAPDIKSKADLLDNATKHKEDISTLIISVIFENTVQESIYFPADREISGALSDNYPNFERKRLLGLFPESLLDFIGYFSSASSYLRELYIELFDVTYHKEKETGKSYVVLPTGESPLLSETASGMQTLIPVLVTLEYFAKSDIKKSYIFEEPELNLFPLTQKKLVEFLAAKVLGNGHKLVITTHSPYILTSLNNLVYAYQVGQLKPNKVINLVSDSDWINPDSIAAYYIEDNNLRRIIDDESKQLRTEEIDAASDEINLLYDALIEIKMTKDTEL